MAGVFEVYVKTYFSAARGSGVCVEVRLWRRHRCGLLQRTEGDLHHCQRVLQKLTGRFSAS
jgi:hypothetical protein